MGRSRTIADQTCWSTTGRLAIAGGHLGAVRCGGRGRRQRHGRSHRAPAVVLSDRTDHLCCPVLLSSTDRFPNHEANRWTRRTWWIWQAYVCVTPALISGLLSTAMPDRQLLQVDERGQPVSPSTVTALVAARAQPRSAPPSSTTITSRGARSWSPERGGTPPRSRAGHPYQGTDGRDRGEFRW